MSPKTLVSWADSNGVIKIKYLRHPRRELPREMARPEGFEPPTRGVEIRCSIP
jgi:hypothetical protein